VALLAAGLLLAGCLGGADQGCSARNFRSNGEQIYCTATSQRGTPVTYMGGPGVMSRGMMGGQFACVTCHGRDGRGGQVRVMMYSYTAPDIRYETLTSPMAHGGESHPPYTDATLKRAITQGVDPAGAPLEAPMPRWQMSAGDLDDLIAYLKTLR
jgi:mono/diheme cytochrome c family protein